MIILSFIIQQKVEKTREKNYIICTTFYIICIGRGLMSTEFFKQRMREEPLWREEAFFNMSTGENLLHTLHLHHIARVECRKGRNITFPLATGSFWCFLLCSAEQSFCRLAGKKKQKLSSDSLLILPPGTHCLPKESAGNFTVEKQDTACFRYYFALKRNFFIEQMFRLPDMQILELEKPGEVFACMEEIFSLVRQNDGCSGEELSILLFRFLTLMLSGREESSDFTSRDRLLEQVKRYPQDYPTLQSLQNIFGVSREKLRKIFQEKTSMSPMNFVVKARLNNSCWMLANTTLPIREVAELNGYKDVAFYCHAFRKHFGISPKKYRDQPERKE